ncbi:MAG TPA: NRDE family protein [Opitutaceae bacterium]|nr:NRDE family protein [Opitutaceae bacterium]
MCTLTWLPSPGGGYDLFFNRDELDRRGPEIAPAIRIKDTVRTVAPRDSEHGGTWISLNEFGLTACLLNYYPDSSYGTGHQEAVTLFRSRGELPDKVADARALHDVHSRIQKIDLRDYRPFHLVTIAAEGEGLWCRWDGIDLTIGTAPSFLTSSSFRTQEVERIRRERFEAISERSRLGLREFHRGGPSLPSAESIRMRRPDGRTRSMTEISVGSGERRLVYERLQWEEGEGIREEFVL